MTNDELKTVRKSLVLTQNDLAKALGVSRVTVANWELGKYPVPTWLPLALKGIKAEQPVVEW